MPNLTGISPSKMLSQKISDVISDLQFKLLCSQSSGKQACCPVDSESHYLHHEGCRELTWSPVDDVTSWWTFRVRLQVAETLLKMWCQQCNRDAPSGPEVPRPAPQGDRYPGK